MLKRGADAAEYYQDPMAYFTGLGVIPGDAYKLARQGDILSFVVRAFLGRFFSRENPESRQSSCEPRAT